MREARAGRARRHLPGTPWWRVGGAGGRMTWRVAGERSGNCRVEGGSAAREGGKGLPGKEQRGKEEKKTVHWLVGPDQSEELVQLVRCESSEQRAARWLPHLLPPTYVPSNHRRRLRSIEFNPANPAHCAVSSLDGTVSFWTITASGRNMSRRFTADCAPSKRWPEDIAWHPSGSHLLAAFEADGKACQVATVRNAPNAPCVALPARPHQKGVINSIRYLPWEGPPFVFATGGSDHGVVLWREEQGEGGGAGAAGDLPKLTPK
ncbi:unnamed protein product, partial [Closterium sp. NIES-54]